MANAIGAALGTVGATVDSIESLEVEEGEKEGEEERVKKARLAVLERVRERAISEAIQKGAIRSEVYIHSEDVVDVAYVAQKVRVRVKAIGPLRDSSQQNEVYATAQDNPHWPYASAQDRERDEVAKLLPPQVEGVCSQYTIQRDIDSLMWRQFISLSLPLSLSPSPSLSLSLPFSPSLSFSLPPSPSPPLSPLSLPVSLYTHSHTGGEWLLSGDDVECVAVGAGLLGCGGGGDPNTGRLIALQQLTQGRTIRVLNPLRLYLHTQYMYLHVSTIDSHLPVQ